MSTSTTNQKTDWKKNNIGALWKKEAKTSGDKYLTGNLSFPFDVKAGQSISVIAFSNKDKKSDNQPDIKVYFSEPSGNSQQPQSKPVVVQKQYAKPEPLAQDVSELL